MLEATGLPFLIIPAEVDETPLASESPEALALRLAVLKARSVSASLPDLPVLSADTVVALGGRTFGKPDNLAQAKATLMALSGKAHRVVTGFAAVWAAKEREKTGLVATEITFRDLTEPEIDRYLNLGQSLDKAGAYAIQMDGAFLVDRLEGSYPNAVGLPLKEALAVLSEVLGRELLGVPGA